MPIDSSGGGGCCRRRVVALHISTCQATPQAYERLRPVPSATFTWGVTMPRWGPG